MARFTIYSPTGTALYTGTPTFTGQYMKPGMLEFREVAIPSLVDLVPGCYVDYTRVTDALGGSNVARRYKIYTVPQLKKQARANSYGGAFVYQSVQFYDASKMLEYCPFRDLVAGDNRIHFSTQPSISTFEGCDGLARRFEACLQDQYGATSWAVRVATQEENPALYELMREPREFTVSGLNILECLNKVYEIWPEVGWIYKVEMVDGVATDTIVIGGGGINPNVGTYAYGKGNGLTSLTRVAANAEEIANRIYAYGSSRNMTLPSWYRNQDIKDAESVDIQNIMLPILPILSKGWSGWGLTNGERDAAKAYVEDDASIAKNGLRPATVYFDGSGEYPEIYPTIREATIGMVRAALGSSSAQYYPRTDIYTNASARVDKILSAQSTYDSGKAADDGKSATFTEYISVSDDVTQTVDPDTKRITQTIITEDITFGSSEAGTRNVSLLFSLSGYVQLYGITGARVYAHLHKGHPANAPVAKGQAELSRDPSNSDRYNFGSLSVTGTKVEITDDTYYIVVDLEVDLTASLTELAFTYDYDGKITASLSNYRSKTFNITLRQVGFDIGERADLGNGKTIAMRSGDCVGRSFAIKTVQYNESGDCWDLECWRSEDESLSQWFPNSQFKVMADDEFVLLDIAMPDIYIGMASERLLTAAQELLADTAVERWQYTPEIDAKFMVEQGRTIRAGEYMSILDIVASDITPGVVSYFKTSGGGYLLTANGERIVVSASSGSVVTVFVDTVVINEGESVIPTYKVTLRDRKKKTWTESQSPESPSSKSVGSMESNTQQSSSSGGGDSYFTLDESGNVTLKSQYQNLWVPGWMAEGGIGSGGGGGGGADLSDVWNSLTNAVTDAYANTKINISHIPLTDLDTWVAQKGYALSSSVPTESTVSGWGFTKNAGTVTSVTINAGTGISVSSSAAITTSGERTISISSTYSTYITHGESAYNSLSNYATKTELESLSGRVTTLENESFFMLDGSGNVTLKSGYSNLWVNGWIAEGGTGSGSSSGGTDLNRVWDSLINNTDKPNVKINIAHIPDITTSKITDLDTWIAGKGYLTTESDPTVPAWAKASSKPSYSLSEISGTDDLLAIEALTGTSGFLRKTGTNTWSLDTTAYLPLTGGTMTGNIVMNGASIVPSANNTSGLGTSSARFAGIYGVNENLSGDLSLANTSSITFGPVTITYDSTNKALHISGTDGGQTIGLYCDGWMAEGGVRQTT